MQKLKEYSTKLYDHIDAPIRKAVAGMNLLGFKTHFSCCGFDYEGQPDFKSHLKPYIFLDYNQIMETPVLKMKLYDLGILAGWGYDNAGSQYIDFYAKISTHVDDPWGKAKSVHFYEKSAIAIARLNETIKRFDKYFLDQVIIEDGNKKSKENVPYWQYQPCEENWIVTKEGWENL